MALEIFYELSLIIIIAAVVSAVMKLLKQPLIIGYIITGIIVSPYLLNLVTQSTSLEIFSHIGISLLLFIVGLSLNFKMLKNVGKISLITGIGQVLFTSIFGFLICWALGFGVITSIYIAVALTFSSTIIIMKLLSDKGDTDTLYGKISIGFLLVQDLIVVFALVIISSISKGTGISQVIIKSIGTMIILIIGVLIFTKYVLQKLVKWIANSQEFLLLFAISWCFAISSLFYFFGFSIEIGALLSGITLASTPYKFEISSKMKPLRDFFLILFFISLGSTMQFGDITNSIIPIAILSLFILIGNPLIVIILMGTQGYTRKNGFLAGLTVAQISEFSLILITMGVGVGHLEKNILSIVTIIGLITIIASSYMITYSHKIYPLLSRVLKIFERKNLVDKHIYHDHKNHEIMLFGYNRIGFDLLKSLKKIKREFLIIDYNPDTVINLAQKNYDTRYGDVSDIELLSEMNFKKSKMIISTIPNTDTNMLLIKTAKEKNKNLIIIVISHIIEDAFELYEAGASYVILPHLLGGVHLGTMIEDFKLDTEKFLEKKIEHIEHLKNIHSKDDKKKLKNYKNKKNRKTKINQENIIDKENLTKDEIKNKNLS